MTHSEPVGIHTRDLVANGTAWVLNKMAFDFRRRPAMGEDIRVVTWHKGSRGFRAYRDFEVLAGDELLASAAALWSFVDLEKKRPRRIPPEWPQAYTIEMDDAVDCDLDAWQPDTPGTDETALAIALRHSDFDPHGHVNNAAYFDFIETLLAANHVKDAALESLRIQFRREISGHATAVTAGLAPSATGGLFRIYDGDQTFVCGEIVCPSPGAAVPRGDDGNL